MRKFILACSAQYLYLIVCGATCGSNVELCGENILKWWSYCQVHSKWTICSVDLFVLVKTVCTHSMQHRMRTVVRPWCTLHTLHVFAHDKHLMHRISCRHVALRAMCWTILICLWYRRSAARLVAFRVESCTFRPWILRSVFSLGVRVCIDRIVNDAAKTYKSAKAEYTEHVV